MSTLLPVNLYSQNAGVSSNIISVPVVQSRAPASTDSDPRLYPIGRIWIDQTANALYVITSVSSASGVNSATWVGVGGGTVDLSTLTDTSGTVVTPTAGNIQIAGTSNQITVTAGSSLLTLTLPSAITTPGSLTTTTGLTAGSGFTVSAGAVTVTSGTSAINISADAAATTINLGTGAAVKGLTLGSTNTTSATTVQAGSGNFNIAATNTVQSKSVSATTMTSQLTNSDNTSGTSHASFQVATGGASSGDPFIDFLVSGAGHYALGIDNSDSDNFVLSASGALGTSNVATFTSAGALTTTTSVTATTSITATLGNITATNGNFVGSTAGTGVSFNVVTASGAASGTVNCNGRVGQVTFTSVSIAAAADLTLTMGNTSIAGASTVLLWSMKGATTGSALSVKSTTPSANQYIWVITNGTGATTTTADLVFNFMVLN